MGALRIRLFKRSKGPFLQLLHAHGIAHQYPASGDGALTTEGDVVEVLRSAVMWGNLATMIVAFIHRGSGRKVIITTKEGLVLDAETLSFRELEELLIGARTLTAIEASEQTDDAGSNQHSR